MYWFNNQFSELTRSILFPGGGGASGGDNYASFNPRSAPDYHSRLPNEPLSGGNNSPRSRGYDDNHGEGDHGSMRSRYRRGGDDFGDRYADRDQYLRDSDPGLSQANRPAAPRPNTPRPDAPRSNLPPILQGPLRLPPIFRPPEGPRPDAPNPTGPLRLPSLPNLPSLTNPLRRPGGGNP